MKDYINSNFKSFINPLKPSVLLDKFLNLFNAKEEA